LGQVLRKAGPSEGRTCSLVRAEVLARRQAQRWQAMAGPVGCVVVCLTVCRVPGALACRVGRGPVRGWGGTGTTGGVRCGEPPFQNP
jgi:hypothetical protein